MKTRYENKDFFPLPLALKLVFESISRSSIQRYIRNASFNVWRKTVPTWDDVSLVHLATDQYLPSDSLFLFSRNVCFQWNKQTKAWLRNYEKI